MLKSSNQPNRKINYDRQMQERLKLFQRQNNRKPVLLLHVCCAPCSSRCLELLSEDFDIIVDFFNPNIATQEEFDKRLNELKRLLEEMPETEGIKLQAPPYNHNSFLETAGGYETEPERGKRCILCYKQRLLQAAQAAKRAGADFFTTTLTISPQKDAQILNRIGTAVGQKEGIEFLPSDFKKRGGYQRSVELSKIYDLYRQDFCGCEFSKRERDLKNKEI